MLVRVKKEEVSLLRELEVATYQETFGPFIKEADMAHYFDNELSLATIEKELSDPESETYFVVKDDRTSSTVYTIVVMNYNDEIEHLYTRSADVYKTNETINAFMDELNVDFTLPQTQVSIEQADTELNISASIHGAGINVIVIKEILV